MPPPADLVKNLNQLLISRRAEQAAWQIQKLAARFPTDHDTLLLLARYEACIGNTQAALRHLQTATRLFPKSPDVHEEWALAHLARADVNAAMTSLQSALGVDPNRIRCLGLVSQLLLDRGAYAQAEESLSRLKALSPDSSDVWNMLGNLYLATGRHDSAHHAFLRASEIEPTYLSPTSNLALLSTYRDDLCPSEVLDIHRNAASQIATHTCPSQGPEQPPAPSHSIPISPKRRIGYLSPDFRTHSVTLFFEPLLAHHDRSRFEVYLYSSTGSLDATSHRLRAKADQWFNIQSLTDQQAASLIRSHHLDLLIDLAGHTGHNRLGIFTLQPTPIQATYLGYPNTTGLSCIDFRISDTTADPPPDCSSPSGTYSSPLCSEQVLAMPGTFFTYPGIISPPDATPPPSLTTGQITFGVPTNIAKITPTALRLWSEILRRLPNSRLQIKAVAANTPCVCDQITHFFQSSQIDPARILFTGPSPFPEYLQLHQTWDLALDTFPFNGHTTTCHCLFMGVPLITLAGVAHSSRMGATTLHQLGLDDLIATTPEQYVEKAVALAQDGERLAHLHATLRTTMRGSYLMDHQAFAKDFEAAILSILNRADRSQTAL